MGTVTTNYDAAYPRNLTAHAAEHASMGGSFRSEILSYRNRFAGTVWSNPSDHVIGDYQVVGAGSSIAMSTSIVRPGETKSVAVTCNRGSATVTDMNVLHAVSPQICTTGRVGVWVYVPDYTLLSGFTLKVSHGDATYTNGAYKSYMLADGDHAYNGWHFVGFNLAEWNGAYGTPNWALAIGAIKLTTTQNSATPATIYVGKIVLGWSSRARLLITADDGYASWFDRGIPVLDALGLRSTSAIIGAQVGSNATWTTWAKIQGAYARGHDMCPHGTHNLATLADDAARAADVESNKNYLIAHNVAERGLPYYIYPNGVYQVAAGDPGIINIIKAAGFKAARSTAVPRMTNSVGDDIDDGIWMMPVLGIDATTTTATLASYLDSLCTYGAVGHVMYHDITVSGATGSVQRNLADFEADMLAIRDRKAAGKLQDVTASEFIYTQGL